MAQTKWVTKYTTKKVWVKTLFVEDWTVMQAVNSKYNMTGMVSSTDSQTKFSLNLKLSMPVENLEMPYAYASAEVTPYVAQTLDMVVPNSSANFVLQLSEVVDGATQVLASMNIIPSIDAHQNIKMTFIPKTNNVTATLKPKSTGSLGLSVTISFGYWKTISVPYLEQEQVLVNYAIV